MTTPAPAPQGYSATQIALHWIVAVLVGAQYTLNAPITRAWDAARQGLPVTFDPLILAHVAGGALILALVVWRLVLRLRRGAPPPPANEPAPLKALGHAAHWGFYALLAAMSLSGALAWFGGVGAAAQAHNLLKVALIALIALHVVAVPFHRIVLKNNVMQRMTRPRA